MINSLNYVKSYEECKRQKREIRSDKSLKNKIRSLVPNQATIKSLLQQKNKHVHESQLLQFYKFWQIPKSQYEKVLFYNKAIQIFSNPVYYMGSEMNFKMFKYFLSKNLLDRKLLNTNKDQQIYQASPKLKKNSDKLLRKKWDVEYQFSNKRLVNYQQPWRYIDLTISKMQAINKVAIKQHQNSLDQTEQNYYTARTERFNPQIQYRTQSKTHKLSSFFSRPHSLSTPNVFAHSKYKQKILERQSKIKNIKIDKQIYQDSQKKLSNQNLLRKISNSQKRLKLNSQFKAYALRQQSADLKIKTQRCKQKKQYIEKIFDTTRNYNEKLRQACLKTTGKNKSMSLNPHKSQQNKVMRSFVNKFSIKSNKSKVRQSVFKKYLEERLGIEEPQFFTGQKDNQK